MHMYSCSFFISTVIVMAASNSSVGRCCLCREALSKDKHKRRKLHHPSATKLKQELQNLSQVPLESLVETAQDNAFLCSICEGSIKSIFTWEEKVAKIKSNITLFWDWKHFGRDLLMKLVWDSHLANIYTQHLTSHPARMSSSLKYNHHYQLPPHPC